MIIDTPFAVESHHVLMIQVADVAAGILRRSAELETYEWPEKYAGEQAQIAEWTALLSRSLLGNEPDGVLGTSPSAQSGTAALRPSPYWP
jgi:hypothetical protein